MVKTRWSKTGSGFHSQGSRGLASCSMEVAPVSGDRAFWRWETHHWKAGNEGRHDASKSGFSKSPTVGKTQAAKACRNFFGG